MIRSPVLRNHYFEVLAAASAQNAGAMNRALDKFDKESAKLEEKKKGLKVSFDEEEEKRINSR
jgi:hypothetical protein